MFILSWAWLFIVARIARVFRLVLARMCIGQAVTASVVSFVYGPRFGIELVPRLSSRLPWPLAVPTSMGPRFGSLTGIRKSDAGRMS